jgi:hypothetical protein
VATRSAPTSRDRSEAYAIGAVVTFVAARRIDGPRGRWVMACAALLVLLGANKQLDLHSTIFALGRRATFALGVYEHRDFLHVLFPMIVGAMMLVVGIALALALRGHARAMAPLLAGFALYAVFLVLRVAVFSHLERVLGWTWLDTEATSLLELAAIALVAGGAMRLARRSSRPST